MPPDLQDVPATTCVQFDAATDSFVCCPQERTCVAGACQCASGTTECGGVCVDLQTNLNNCGGCGNVCGTLPYCVNGRCCFTPTFY